MAKLVWDDIQCLIRRGLGEMPISVFVLLKITDISKAKLWLGSLEVTAGTDIGQRASQSSSTNAINIAFTSDGLRKLGFDLDQPNGFSREFCEGMAPMPLEGDQISRRSSMLGDVGLNHPKDWLWGGYQWDEDALKFLPNPRPVHLVLMVFGRSDVTDVVDPLVGNDITSVDNGLEIIQSLEGRLPKDKKEHFGFLDGISQPFLRDSGIEPSTENAARLHSVAPGEFVIGYRNERGNFPISPLTPDGRDFGRNGTYLVLRELEQNVPAFESWLDESVKELPDLPVADRRKWLAAKAVGRWPNGAPLTCFPDNERTSEEFGKFRISKPEHVNDFFYHSEDPEGLRCPMGAHIRRAWPRDSLGSDPNRALTQAQLHRILRRGRLFGPAYDRDDPHNPDNGKRRGLYFTCLNADISGQFEAIQHNWINNPKFSGLNDERDPLVGEQSSQAFMTVQKSPANLRVEGLRSFVRMRGGGYFFMPGLQAIKTLATGF